MHCRSAFFGVALAALSVLVVSAAPDRMPIDLVKPGMVGVGRTVFDGERIEEFNVQFIGVLRNVIGPSRNLILARLEGGPLATTGVIAGMSGSPVYVDGRLVGAVSYSLGAFSKEPIAGITPIDEMVEAAAQPVRRPATVRAQLELPVTQASLAATLRRSFTLDRPFAESPADVQVLASGSSAVGSHVGPMLRPISTPLVLGGFAGDVADLLAGAFREVGFTPMSGVGGTSTSVPVSKRPLAPGDAVGVSLIDGDLSLGGTGTVTHVEDGRVYAFGHPFYNLGPTEFPMTRAYVHALLPSLMASSKLSTMGEVIGTFQQDRAVTIAGELGAGPSLIPINVALETGRGQKRTFSFKVVRDQLFTPVLAYAAVLNTLKSYEREFGAATFTVKGRALIRKHGEVNLEDLFTGESPSVGAATYVAAPLTFLLKNDYEPVEIDGIDIAIAASEEPRTASIERIWLDTTQVHPGRTVPLKILMRTYRGDEVTRTVPIDVPTSADGPLTIMVADGSRLAQWEQREARQSQQAQGVAQMVRALNKARKNNRVYVRLLGQDTGAVVSGEFMSSLPPSVLSVIEADRNGGQFVPLRTSTLGEWDIPTDYAVSGARFLSVNVEAD
jgi:hypothetical protein